MAGAGAAGCALNVGTWTSRLLAARIAEQASGRQLPQGPRSARRMRDDAAVFDIDVKANGQTLLMTLTGELDISGVDAFRENFSAAREQSPQSVVIDLRGLTFIDSTGLRLVVDADRAARQDGFRLWIVRSPALKNVLHVSGLDKVLPLVDDPPAAP
jgi:anti-anti-sigma factor